MTLQSFGSRVALLPLVLTLVPACAVEVVSGGGVAPGEGSPSGAPQPSTDPSAAYAGKGFVVHEWGTDTVVVGSDGSLQRGLHHEEEDLPGFVYDRIRAGTLPDATSVHVKMETPVTYFYSDKPMQARVQVAFPSGVLTQWYPAVASFYPWVAKANAVPNLLADADPVLDPSFPWNGPTCQEKHGAVGQGLLDWGEVEILPRGADVELPEASLDAFTWSHARAVDANAVRVTAVPTASGAPEAERFLFYRGLGNLTPPARVTAAANTVRVENTLPDALGALFVVNVGEASGAFSVVPAGVLPGQTVDLEAPALVAVKTLDVFVEALGEAVTTALDGAGLYHDESLAMVATWKRQWFRTPGLRVFYLAPQTWTDATLPLTVDPAPDHVTRVMMIRVEVITPDLEAGDVAAAKGLSDPATEAAAKAHFLGLGRFAEPRLRRALGLLAEPSWGAPFLAAVTSAETRATVGE
ncbi:hypothetical protein [Polyangium mundeleinium]|uniref:Uncharacterized protein n=1 Tax=Polyangium mundeleinium TaxID=2995306 RepID=A0ABT5F071_9BACT|nr:hypothetical protein [Polyangium mundeleinium]MDC0747486.1 hypothetical protein [Polyangium mundeleinium]